MKTQRAQTGSGPEHGEDDEQAAREWADAQAEWIGRIWQRRYPGGRDW